MRKTSEDRLLRIARKQMERSDNFENAFIKSYLNDLMFANADPDNNWQWPGDLFRNRQLQGRATLTINQVRTLNNNIINEVKQNPPGIVIRATGGEATVQSAKAYSGLVREITRRSRFSNIVTRAARFQVDGGVGYWRVLPEWVPGTMVQRIKIGSIRNMTAVRIDCDAKEPDKSDAKWGFVIEDTLKDEVHKKHPKTKTMALGSSTLNTDSMAGWMTETHYRVAEWYNLEEEADELVLMIDDDGKETTQYLSRIPDDPINQPGFDGKSIRDAILEDPMTQRRKVMRPQMMYRKIIGSHILEEKKWPGKYVPLVQCVGDEVEVNGIIDRKGNTRLLKDAQRMLNYWTSSATQSVALQTRVPWLVDLRAIEGYETYWASANIIDHAYLPYRSVDSEGKELQMPKKIPPPEMSNAYMTGMQFSNQQLMTISGQRENARDMEQDNLQSGRAIRQRKVQSETSTFGFRDNIDIAVEYTGRIILDMAEYIYDTPRMIRAIMEDNKESEISLNPQASVAYREQPVEGEENASKIEFNPTMGTYDVDASSGPNFETQREYAVEALSTIVSTNTALWGTIGDLLVKNMDFPGADEMAERLRRTIPKEVLGEGPTPTEKQLKEQNDQLTRLIENFTALLAEKNLELKNKDEKLTIDAENAITKRIKEVGNAVDDLKKVGLGADAAALIKQAVTEALGMKLSEDVKLPDAKPNMDGANPQAADAVPPPGLPEPMTRAPLHPAGKIADDGHEYVEHQPGQFAKVEPPAPAGGA